jgi:hypothetical protein
MFDEPITMMETTPGQYEGSYTISGRDKLTAQSAVTASLRLGNPTSRSPSWWRC